MPVTSLNPMRSKLSRIKEHMDRGEETEALRIAAKFQQLGEQKERITRAWAAHMNPEMYAAMGYDVNALFADGIKAIRERYGLDTKGGTDA